MDRKRIKEVIECLVKLNRLSDQLEIDIFDDIFVCLEHIIDDYFSVLGCHSAVSEIIDMIYDDDKLNNLYKNLE